MSYLDTLRRCKYTSPSGAVFELQYEGLERSGGKKLSVNEPPQQDRAEAQDLGNSGIRLPMTLFISGQDYTAEADAFYAALAERYSADKPATLSHPRWGDILVCPTTWTQVESFVEGMGQATFTVEFLRLDRLAKFPATTTDAGGQLQADIDAANAAAQDAYSADGAPSGPADTANVTAKSKTLLGNIGEKLASLATAADDLGAKFSADLASALGSIDALVAAPSSLALSVMSLASTPANAAIGISDKTRQYSAMVEAISASPPKSFAEAALLFLGLCSGSVGAATATLSGDLGTRAEAVESADLLDGILSALIAAIEAAQAAVAGWLPDAEAMSLVSGMLSSARSRMLDASFSLKTERRKRLVASVDPNTCVYDLYGTWSDALLDQFAADNDLADDEWFMLPAGREVVWYA